MKKSYFLSVGGGLMLMAASVAANAEPILFEVGSAGLQGTMLITGLPNPAVNPPSVLPAAPDGFTINLTNLSGFNLGNTLSADPNTTITFSPNVENFDNLAWQGNPFRLDPSPCTPTPCTPPDPSTPGYTGSSDTITFLNGYIFSGTGTFTSDIPTLTFGPTASGNPTTGTFTLDLTGNLILGIPGGGTASLPINSALTLAASNITGNSMTLNATEICRDASNFACFETIASLIDAQTQTPGQMDDNFWVRNNVAGDPSGALLVPEPTSLALFGVGLAGLGWTRRIKKAA